MATPIKPLVLVCSTPVSGHIIPMRTIAKDLVARGYDVCFVTGSGYRQYVETIGASFVPVQGYGDFHDLRARELDPDWLTFEKTLEGPGHFIHDLVHIFCKSLPSQYEALQRALKLLNDKHPGRPVIVLTESLNFAALPIKFGAPGIRPAGTIAIGLNPVLLTSIDHPPFGLGLPPDSSPEGQERNKLANETQKQVFSLAQSAYGEALMSVGAREPDIFLLDALYVLPDRFVQMCTPSAEYPRSDAPKTLRWAGGYPKAVRDLNPTRPSWWDEITSNTTKKIVFVCQGTVCPDFNQLVVPTMTAFKDRSDIIVVVALAKEGATLPADVSVPSNCKVVDYIPYDELLPYCDVFITTGGYGSYQRALKNGTPLVVAATTEEKPETAMRAEFIGVAVNLRTSFPSVKQLQEAVDEVLSNKKYKTKAAEIQAEIATFDPVGVIVDNIEDLAGRSV
ncbi:UDP-glucosyltransferase A1 [Lachnellula suecica]|uniref:UDP-glucosyltransferase A1 n=1 Tax=Lachnellula suecica TaxID=602035 RepID=A0A8T9CJA3_9HELO|nr:UDP-glucosyltransferase A1 [Lachnellula suecica]